MAHQEKNLPVRNIRSSLKQTVYYVVIFFLGLICMYGISNFTQTKKSIEETYLIRKPSTNKLIAPLLLGGDNNNFYEEDLFSKTISNYIAHAIKDGDAQNISYYFKNLTTGTWTGVNENEHYAPASLMKVPVMIAIFRQAESDPSILKKELLYTGASDLNKEEYYKPQKYIIAGNSYTVEKLVDYMIMYSDNNATALLLSITSKNNLTEIFTDLGLPVPSDATTGTLDYMSDKLYSRLFRVLYNSTYLNEEYSIKALEILSYSDFPAGIVTGIPKEISVASKFGERTIYREDTSVNYRELHDCVIVYLTKNPYLVCIMTKGNDFKKLEGVIQHISDLTYHAMKK